MTSGTRLAPPEHETVERGTEAEEREALSLSPSPSPVPRSAFRWAGRLRAAWWAEDTRRPRWQGWLWTLVLLALVGWMAARVEAFDWYTDYPATAPNGAL